LCDGDTDCPDGSDESTQECGTKQECRTDQAYTLLFVVVVVVDVVAYWLLLILLERFCICLFRW